MLLPNEMAESCIGLLSSYQGVAKKWKAVFSALDKECYGDIKVQLGQLVYPGFMGYTGLFWLGQSCRDYFKGIEVRARAFSKTSLNKGKCLCDGIRNFVAKPMFARKKKAHRWQSVILIRISWKYRWMLEEYRLSFCSVCRNFWSQISEKKVWQNSGKEKWKKIVLVSDGATWSLSIKVI